MTFSHSMGLLPILLLLSGCIHGAAIFKQIKNDPAEWDVDIDTIYGKVHAHRNFPANWTPPVAAQRRPASSNLPVMPPQVFGWEWVAMPKTNAFPP